MDEHMGQPMAPIFIESAHCTGLIQSIGCYVCVWNFIVIAKMCTVYSLKCPEYRWQCSVIPVGPLNSWQPAPHWPRGVCHPGPYSTSYCTVQSAFFSVFSVFSFHCLASVSSISTVEWLQIQKAQTLTTTHRPPMLLSHFAKRFETFVRT